MLWIYQGNRISPQWTPNPHVRRYLSQPIGLSRLDKTRQLLPKMGRLKLGSRPMATGVLRLR